MPPEQLPPDYIAELESEFEATDGDIAGRLPLAELDAIREEHDFVGQNSPADAPLPIGEIASMREYFARTGYITPAIDAVADPEDQEIEGRRAA